MSQKNLIIVVVVILVLGLITYWFVKRGKAPVVPAPTPSPVIPEATPPVPPSAPVPGPEVPPTPSVPSTPTPTL